MISINLNSIFKAVLICLGIVFAGHILGVVSAIGVENIQKGTFIIRDMFYFGHEKSLSALYSAGLFILLGCFFRAISFHTPSNHKGWYIISYIAVFLACDEWFAIHDAALNIYGRGPLNIPYWVWVYGTLTIILAISLIPFLKAIPRYLMKWLIISGLIFISGSAIMEVVTYSFNDTGSLIQNIGWFFEDGLEMVGVLTMILASISWLKKQGVTELVLNKKLTYFVCLVGFLDLFVSYLIQIKVL